MPTLSAASAYGMLQPVDSSSNALAASFGGDRSVESTNIAWSQATVDCANRSACRTERFCWLVGRASPRAATVRKRFRLFVLTGSRGRSPHGTGLIQGESVKFPVTG